MDNSLNQSNTKSKKNNECIELKNITYQSLLLNGNQNGSTINSLVSNKNNTIKSLEAMNSILSKEIKSSNIESKQTQWSRLSIKHKLDKLYKFIDEHYSKDKELKKEDINYLKKFIRIAIDRKKLQRTDEIKFDDNGNIIEIPSLVFNKGNKTKRFTLKRTIKSSNNKTKKQKKK